MYLGDIYTSCSEPVQAFRELPFPVGRTARGLPIGIQLIGNCFMEKKILQAAYAYEKATGRI